MTSQRPYHHGDLQQVVIDAAVAAITESGPSALSLRDLARRAGVSHAAPAHHFKDKAGVLTAVAVQGFELLADALDTAQEHGGFSETAVAYVRFAREHRAHFEVMYRPDTYHRDDPKVLIARRRAGEVLDRGVATVVSSASSRDVRLEAVAAWSLVHGFATLWLNQALPTGPDPTLEPDPETTMRSVARLLFSDPVHP